ncbi:hypothetical protein C2S53_017280 [Perilla frutescens var. hirtella]|uniref:Replication factor A C-terminal domain-containing protein n=1 Tax=Perilla frutescens var. hirtella TaxID=608512 RepID=A0AAD4JJY6_PERFH|nr:hypothetical protein C2S53_017280 [Perilla frutescens var. hirtella]
MAPVFGTIDMLKPGRSTFGLELRLIRCYENSNSGGVECIFHDRQAERIHVTISGSNSENFKHRLIEGSVYALIDFVIGLNIMKYWTTSCIHKIIVFKHTRLFEVFHEEFPKCLFELKTFADIAQMENVGDSAMFEIDKWQDDKADGHTAGGRGVDSTEEPISSLRSVDGNIDDVVIQKTIQQVIDEKQIGEFWIHGTIKSIESVNRFAFLASKRCLKELQPQDELKFFCEQCQTFDICGKSRYKLDVEVGDGTGETILDMWDIQGLELIGKKPAEDQVLDIQPTEIDEIVGAKGFFKIIVMHEKMKGPFIVVKESVRRSKGKRKMHGDAHEAAYICDALETPPTMKSTTERKNSADLINEDETNRKLIDEFSSNALKKRQKRNVKKE